MWLQGGEQLLGSSGVAAGPKGGRNAQGEQQRLGRGLEWAGNTFPEREIRGGSAVPPGSSRTLGRVQILQDLADPWLGSSTSSAG